MIVKMNKSLFRYISISLIGIALLGCGTQEKLLVCGCSWDKVAIVDKKTGQMEWVHQLQKGDDCNDIELTKAGNILYAYKGGARLITNAQQVIWDFKVEKGQELFTATELPSGEYLLAVCANPSRIITLNDKGEKIKELNFDSGIKNVHGQFRQIVQTPENTYLIPLMEKGEVIELTQSNEVVRRIEVGGNPFSVKIQPDGNWLVSCGDAHKFVIVDPHSQLVTDGITNEDILNVSLLFVAETHPYRNGNVMIANWSGHANDRTQPQLIELDSKKRVVWTLNTKPEDVKISAFYSFRAKKYIR